MPRRGTGTDVFAEAIDRMVRVYESGDRVVVSFSAGKDSGVILEICIIAATITGNLPVDVIMRDDEIDVPGTFEYAERTAARDDVNFHWVYAQQPVINVFNRKQPYFWAFDPAVPRDEWVRQPPDFAYFIPDKNILAVNSPDRFPPPQGRNLVSVTGLRTVESAHRLLGLHSSGGYMTQADRRGVRNCRPIYDWRDGDVWKAIGDNGWDYNHAYDTLMRMGLGPKDLRIAPPTQNIHALPRLMAAARAWPRWFDRVCDRLPGVRQAALFGVRAATPERKLGETWEDTFQRECIDEAPDWVAERATAVRDKLVPSHEHHSTTPFPDQIACPNCGPHASWKKLSLYLYGGDPFAFKYKGMIGYVEPEFFREGSGTWDGPPTW